MSNKLLFCFKAVGMQTGWRFSTLAMNLFSIILCGLMLSLMPVCCQTLDSFNPNVASFYGGGSVGTIAIQPDGKVLLAGSFDLVSGLNRSCIARVNADGSLDPTFNPDSHFGIGALEVQPDGKIIVAGGFTAMGGQSHTNLARLNTDGSVDSSFNANASSSVFVTSTQPDGRILVGGPFTNLAGQSCMHIGRLNTDGSLDTNFNASANNSILTIAQQTNGCVLVGGTFTNLNGAAVNYLGRLNPDGSLDTTFNPQANSAVYAITVQPDNLILVGGTFTNIASTARNRIARLNNNGSVDASFNPGASNRVSSIALQANGKIIVAGLFANLAGTACNYIGRLNANGTLDATFNPVASNYVYAVALQKDGKVLVGGTFTNLAGGQRNAVGRLNNNDAATESFTNTASSAIWMRGGSSPEFWRTSFDFSTNGVGWNHLGDGSRIAGGWQLTGVSVPAHASLRVTGFSSLSAWLSSSSGCIQSLFGVPFIVAQPVSQDIILKNNAAMNVVAGGTAPLNYQWQLNGTNLNSGGKISGATTTALSISSLAGTNAGAYSVVITNSYGSVTSQVASLSVVNAITNDTFNPSVHPVYTTACQPDGKVIIGGSFSRSIGGRNYFALMRANSDGSTDTLLEDTWRGNTCSVNLQSDGRMLVGGSGPYFQRLNTDGTPDALYTASADGAVYATAQQPDGKILVAGNFSHLNNQPVNRIARLNSDGTIDTNFSAGASNTVYCVALQTNGQIIVGGSFTNLNGSVHNHIARLNSNGALDVNFNPSIDIYFAGDNPVYCLTIQPDGKILVGGSFFLAEGGLIKPWLMRLNSDGTLDTTFSATPNNAVYSLALQTDGKILIGGTFTLINGVTQNYLARLNSDGTLDLNYVASASSTVYSIAIQPDGKVLVGGNFSALYDSKYSNTRFGIGRFSNTKIGTHSLLFDGSTITWLRGGTTPELAWVVFDASNDGINWSVLGKGIPTAGGWQLTGVSTTVTNCIRGWGYIPCGEYNGSGWCAVDALTLASNNPPTIITNDNSVGFTTRTTTGFGFNIAALTGQTVMVECSTNLQNWSPVITNVVTFSPFYFFDSSQLPAGSKFYRTRLF